MHGAVCLCLFVCVCAAIFGQPATAVSLAGWVTTIHTLFSCCEANSSCNRERRSDLNRWLAQGISTADRLHAAWTHRDSLAARHPAPGTEALPKSTGCERKGCSPSLPELAATWDRPHAVHAANRRRKRRKKGKKKKGSTSQTGRRPLPHAALRGPRLFCLLALGHGKQSAAASTPIPQLRHSTRARIPPTHHSIPNPPAPPRPPPQTHRLRTCVLLEVQARSLCGRTRGADAGRGRTWTWTSLSPTHCPRCTLACTQHAMHGAAGAMYRAASITEIR